MSQKYKSKKRHIFSAHNRLIMISRILRSPKFCRNSVWLKFEPFGQVLRRVSHRQYVFQRENLSNLVLSGADGLRATFENFLIFNPTLGNAAGFFLVAGANLDNNIYRNCSAKINIEVVNNEEYTVFRRFLAFIRQKYIIRKGLKKIIFLQLIFNINKIRLISSLTTETGIAKKVSLL